MKAVIQRVHEASCKVDGKIIGKIGKGFLIFLGIAKGDTEKDLQYLVKKISAMRIFEDSEGKMNLALSDVGGEALVISQFTLLADTKKGNRPSFFDAALPDEAIPMYEAFIQEFRALGIPTRTGEFGADMKISLINDGPVTILLDTKKE